MTKIRICKEEGCNNSQTTKGYCRLHYLRNWKLIKAAKQKDAAKRLNKYIENIVDKHPDRYVEVIKREIKSRRFEKNVVEEYGQDIDDVYKLFNDPGYDAEIERLIQDLKVEKKF
jgi:hypothetical protein